MTRKICNISYYIVKKYNRGSIVRLLGTLWYIALVRINSSRYDECMVRNLFEDATYDTYIVSKKLKGFQTLEEYCYPVIHIVLKIDNVWLSIFICVK